MQTRGSPPWVRTFGLPNHTIVSLICCMVLKGRSVSLVTEQRWDAYSSAARELDRARDILQNLVLSPQVRGALLDTVTPV